MKSLPGLVFIIDPVEEHTAIAEARKLGIPIVAVCDTNCNPDDIDHPVPGNDDAIRAVKLFCSIVADAVLEGKGMVAKADDVADESKEADVSVVDANTNKTIESEVAK